MKKYMVEISFDSIGQMNAKKGGLGQRAIVGNRSFRWNGSLWHEEASSSGSVSVEATPISGSDNPVSADGVYNALIDKIGFENASTYASIDSSRSDLRFVIISTDETNGGATNQVYLFNGTTKIAQITNPNYLIP